MVTALVLLITFAFLVNFNVSTSHDTNSLEVKSSIHEYTSPGIEGFTEYLESQGRIYRNCVCDAKSLLSNSSIAARDEDDLHELQRCKECLGNYSNDVLQKKTKTSSSGDDTVIITLVYFDLGLENDDLYLKLHATWIDHILNDDFLSRNTNPESDSTEKLHKNNSHKTTKKLIFATLIISLKETRKLSIDELNMSVSSMIQLLHTEQLHSSLIFAMLNCIHSSLYYNIYSILSSMPSTTSHRMLLHLNHEQPFQVPINNTVIRSRNHCYGDSVTVLKNLYENYFDVVIRQHYFELYDNSTLYMPLGTSQYSYLQQFTSEFIKASQRTNFCFFSGRIDYELETEYNTDRKEIQKLIDEKRRVI